MCLKKKKNHAFPVSFDCTIVSKIEQPHWNQQKKITAEDEALEIVGGIFGDTRDTVSCGGINNISFGTIIINSFKGDFKKKYY